ncbi:MAG: hypothetical protein J6V28_04385 [Tidjanibacter sp.]|nr:hypothetical protein [Tidjanibacter sp.]
MKLRNIAIVLLSLSAILASSCSDDRKEPDVKPRVSGKIVRDVVVPSVNLNGEDGIITLYLPSDYETSGKRYPVLYLLHGMWGDQNDWANNSMHTTCNNIINAGDCSELIVVMPYGANDFYVNGFTAGVKWETYFHEELIPFVEKNYPCRTDRSSRAIAGLSMGGFGTVYHAYNYPEKFCVAYSMSGAVEGMGWGAAPSLKMIFEQKGYTAEDYASLPELYLECGKQDTTCYPANLNTHDYLERINFPHTYLIRDGIHDWAFWNLCLPKALRAVGKHFAVEEAKK